MRTIPHFHPSAISAQIDKWSDFQLDRDQLADAIDKHGHDALKILVAVFAETDDFDTTGDHVAVISGKGGSKRAGFSPTECHGPYAKNRLAVVATEDEVGVMLDHALAHLRLRA